MQRLALALAFGAVVAALLPAPAQFLGLGLGIAAIGTGRVVYTRTALPGAVRLTAAGAITVGCIGLALGLARVALTLAAIGRIDGMLS
jgi:hypothetical protein